MYVCVVYVYTCMWVCTHVSMCMCVYVCMWLRVTATRTRSWDPNPVTGDSDLCLLWTRYTGDSKTDSWDDSGVSAGSCSKDQMAIQFQNHVISCECLFLCIFLINVVNRCLCFTCIISCDPLIYFTIMITCIASRDISECSLLLYSLSESLWTSFHVMVGCYYWFRTSWGIPYTMT